MDFGVEQEYNHLDTLVEQGYACLRKGNVKQASFLMEKALTIEPLSSTAHWILGLCREQTATTPEELQAAASDISRSIVYSSEPHPGAFGRRGILYYRMGHYEKALQDLDKALDMDRYWAEAYFYRGLAHLSLRGSRQDLLQAVLDFSSAMKYHKPFSEGLYWRAQAYRQLGQEEESFADLTQALALEPEHAGALNALAYSYENALGVERDERRAVELYTFSARLGHPPAQRNLAHCYENGIGCQKNLEHSFYWMELAADQGDEVAQNQVGLRCLRGYGTKESPTQAVRYFRMASKSEFAPAVCNLGECYEYGTGVDKDLELAFSCYERACELGYTTGQYRMALHYFYGIGRKEDDKKAFSLLKPLADGGLAPAQDLVGICYEQGYGVEPNQSKSQQYFNKAFNQGHPLAAYHLAVRYHRGLSVKRNLTKAARLYLESARKGYTTAYYSLGRLYYDDLRDFEQAAQSFRLGSEAGQKNLLDWQAKALMRTKDPRKYAPKIIQLLETGRSSEEDSLYCALLLRRMDFLGFAGTPLNEQSAVQRVKALLPGKEDPKPGNLSCAYVFLGQAYELGLGVEKNQEEALSYYHKAEAISNRDNNCRCFVSYIAHSLITGLGGVKANRLKAKQLLMEELAAFKSHAAPETVYLYLWLILEEQTEHSDLTQLEELIQHAHQEDPNDILAIYYLLQLDCIQSGGNAKRLKQKLENLYPIVSPYDSFRISRQMGAPQSGLLYPILTSQVIDDYYAASI